ncbi:response regulator [Brevundimonas sp.]|uniref:response regulator n=1 Tax=Brevundimonas sp. TaxID=1871086 RepID=UPI0035B04661
MPTIECCVEKVEPVAPDVEGAQLLARFKADPSLLAIPVVDQDRPLGLITRDAFLMTLAGPFGHSLCRARRAVDLMDSEAPIFDAGLTLESLPASILEGSADALLAAFIVTRGGRYVGVGPGLGLVRANNARLRVDVVAAKAELARVTDDCEIRRTAAEAKSDYLQRLGRGLRTPLNGVGAVAEMLSRQPIGDSAQAHVQTIIESADATLRILQDAIDLARAEAGDLPITAEPCALRPLVDDLQAELVGKARAADVSLMLSYEGDTELAARIDGERLKQVLRALIVNAVDHARHGLVEASLSAACRQDTVTLKVQVRDDGGETDRTDLAFETAPNEAGLGLAICRRIVDALGGVLKVSRNRGRGATFGFALKAPRAVIVDADTTGNVASLPEVELAASPHVLIVDDNATNRVVAQALCEMFGCTCETAEDGLQALEAVRSRHFDVVLMDIKMPRMDGVEATAAIRALAAPAGQTPIIALTANADPDDARRYLEVGMAAVVEKPIKPERLRLAMNTALVASEPGVETQVTKVA